MQDMLVGSVLFQGLIMNKIISKLLSDFSAIGAINAEYISADNQEIDSRTLELARSSEQKVMNDFLGIRIHSNALQQSEV